MKQKLQQVKRRLLKVSSQLSSLARQGQISEVWLIQFDKELIAAIDFLDFLISHSLIGVTFDVARAVERQSQ